MWFGTVLEIYIQNKPENLSQKAFHTKSGYIYSLERQLMKLQCKLIIANATIIPIIGP